MGTCVEINFGPTLSKLAYIKKRATENVIQSIKIRYKSPDIKKMEVYYATIRAHQNLLKRFWCAFQSYPTNNERNHSSHPTIYIREGLKKSAILSNKLRSLHHRLHWPHRFILSHIPEHIFKITCLDDNFF